jgi:hypothetical protein
MHMFRYLFRRTHRYVPFVNLAVSTTCLIFQTTVLYPWNEKLSKELSDIKDVKQIII